MCQHISKFFSHMYVVLFVIFLVLIFICDSKVMAADQQVEYGNFSLSGAETYSAGTADEVHCSSYLKSMSISLDSIDFTSISGKFDLTVSGTLSNVSYGGVTSSYNVNTDNSQYYISADGIKKYVSAGTSFEVVFENLDALSSLMFYADYSFDIMSVKSGLVVIATTSNVSDLVIEITYDETGSDGVESDTDIADDSEISEPSTDAGQSGSLSADEIEVAVVNALNSYFAENKVQVVDAGDEGLNKEIEDFSLEEICLVIIVLILLGSSIFRWIGGRVWNKL